MSPVIKRRAAREARDVRRVHVREPHPFGGECVDVRRRGPVIAVAAEVIGAQRVDVEIQQAHEFRPIDYDLK